MAVTLMSSILDVRRVRRTRFSPSIFTLLPVELLTVPRFGVSLRMKRTTFWTLAEIACVAFLSIDLFLLNGLAVLPGVAAVFAEGVLLVLVSEVTLVVTLFVQARSIVFSHSIHLS